MSDIDIDIERVGFAGLGLMGGPMARRLVGSGRRLVAWSRTAAKASALAHEAPTGQVAIAPSPGALASCDVVILMLIDDAAVQNVLTGMDGVLDGPELPKAVINMSTVGILMADAMREACAAHGVAYIAAPVSGSTSYAASGDLTVIASGPDEVVAAVRPLLDVFARQIVITGPGTEANLAKLCVNLIIGATNQAVAESLALGTKGGIEPDVLLAVLDKSVIASPWLRYKIKPLSELDFAPGHTMRGLDKDWSLMVEASRALEVPLPVTSMVHQKIRAGIAHGYGELDMIAVIKDAFAAAGIAR